MPDLSRNVRVTEQAVSVRYNNRVYELVRAGARPIVLSLGEALFDVPLLSFDELPYPAVNHYSHSRGIPELRERIASYYAELGVAADPETEILVTAGSKAAIQFALMAALDAGDEVLMHEPHWVSYPEQTSLCGGVPIQMPHSAPIDAVQEFITERTQVMIVNNPNNPRGAVLTRSEMETLRDAAERTDAFLLADEAYSDFVVDEQFVSFGALDPRFEHTIICNSLSKGFGISGWRIGYVIANARVIDELLKVNQHVITCAPTILEHYAARYFDQLREITAPQIRAVVAKRAEVAMRLQALGVDCMPGTSTFYLFASIAPSVLSSEEFSMRLLDEHGVAVVPGSGYGSSCDSYVRISVGAEPPERISEGIERLAALIEASS